MKKLLTVLLALLIAFLFAACGTKDSEEDTTVGFNEQDIAQSTRENSESATRISDLEITEIKMSKEAYASNEPIAVSLSWSGTPESSAWVGIIPADVPHGSEEKNDEYDIDYRYLIDFENGAEIVFEVYLEPGSYTMRVSESDGGGVELASANFTVTES